MTPLIATYVTTPSAAGELAMGKNALGREPRTLQHSVAGCGAPDGERDEQPGQVGRANQAKESSRQSPAGTATRLERVPGNDDRPRQQQKVTKVLHCAHAGSVCVLFQPEDDRVQRASREKQRDEGRGL